MSWPTVPPVQRLGFAAENLDGIRRRRFNLEVSTDLLLDTLSISLVLPFGDVLTMPRRWAEVFLCALFVGLIWETLCTPWLRIRARTMRNLPQILPITISARRRWTRKAPRILALAASHLLEWLAGSTWLIILLLVLLQPSAMHMIQPKINMQAVIFLVRLICRKFRAVIKALWISR
jgi:hypothetical protein